MFRQTFQMVGWAERLNDMWVAKGWSGAELARRSGVNKENVYKYLRGTVKQPRGDILDKLADALGVARLWLKEDVPPKHPPEPDVIPAKTTESGSAQFAEAVDLVGRISPGDLKNWLSLGQSLAEKSEAPPHPLPSISLETAGAEPHDGVVIGVCRLDRKFRYLKINPWLANLNGLSVKDHIGRKISKILPDVWAGIEAQLQQVFETGRPIIEGSVKAETHATNGEKQQFSHCFYPIFDMKGTVASVECVVETLELASGCAPTKGKTKKRR